MPAIMVSDQGKKVQTKDILEVGKYPVVDQGKIFIRGYCDDSEKVINVAEPIVLFGDHTRETKLIDFDFVVGAYRASTSRSAVACPQRRNMTGVSRVSSRVEEMSPPKMTTATR